MAVTKDELLDRARALAPGIAARALETERLRAPHDDTIQELIDAGFMQLLVPARWGGHEMDLSVHLEVIEILSAACMSTGWIAAFYMGHNWMATRLSEQAQAEIFGERPFGLIPATTAPSMTGRRVAGGWEISGRGSWGSGIMHADWLMTGGLPEAEAPRLFLVPMSDVRVVDVWHMSAMAGTGSNDFEIDAAFVPDHRSMPALDFLSGETPGASLHANPLYRLPLLPFIYCEILGVFSGGLRGATDAFDDVVQARVATHSGSAMRDRQHAHVTLGEAHARARIAERLACDQIRQTEEQAAEGPFQVEDRLRLKLQAGFVVDHCRRAVNDLVHQAGSSNFAMDAPLQRFFRDLNMLATHAFWDWEVTRELYGRQRLGLPPNHLMF